MDRSDEAALPDRWTSADGLCFVRQGDAWEVHVAREMPRSLGDPIEIELPARGAAIRRGEMLAAIELVKVRIEFEAPHDLSVCEVGHTGVADCNADDPMAAWRLVIRFG